MSRRPQAPGFLIIGAQKCGTTWLHRHLSQQSEIWMPPEKELEFFSYSQHLDDPGVDAYRNSFEAAGDRLAGEATASYFWTHADSPWCHQPDGFQRDIPGVIRACLDPGLRFIVVVRNPVERALSAWAHYVIHGELDADLPFEAAAHYGGIVDMGFYGRHFAAWRSYFPADQFLVLGLEQDIIVRPKATLQRAKAFLGFSDGRPPADSDDLATPAFPGLPRTRQADRSVRIPLPDGRHLHASAEDLDTLAQIYRPDQEQFQALLAEAEPDASGG